MLYYNHLPWLSGAERLGHIWTYPGGTHDNRNYLRPHITFDPKLEEWQQVLCFSPETSGGLLMAIPPEQSDTALRAAEEQGQSLWRIGEVVAGSQIEVLP